MPGVLDLATIALLVQRSPLPVSVMTGPGGPTVGELAAVGVRRVGVGTAIAEAAYGLVQRAAVELLLEGTCKAIRDHLTYVELSALAQGARS